MVPGKQRLLGESSSKLSAPHFVSAGRFRRLNSAVRNGQLLEWILIDFQILRDVEQVAWTQNIVLPGSRLDSQPEAG